MIKKIFEKIRENELKKKEKEEKERQFRIEMRKYCKVLEEKAIK